MSIEINDQKILEAMKELDDEIKYRHSSGDEKYLKFLINSGELPFQENPFYVNRKDK